MQAVMDHEKLDVYQLELQFITWVTPLIEKSRAQHSAVTAEVRDQLDRASVSMTLNTAEGNGRRQMRTRGKFFDDARGSTAECAACLDILVAKGVATAVDIDAGKQLLVRIASMLSKLVQRFSDEVYVREDAATYDVEDLKN